MNITSKNLKLVIGATYLIALFAVLYFVFSFIDVKDLTNYEFIRAYKESIFQYKNNNLFLLTIVFFIFTIVWILVLVFGVIVSMIDINPIEIIKFAQFSNSLLLPIIAIILLWIVNNNRITGSQYSYNYQNIFGAIIIIISIVLGARGIISIF